MSAIEGIMLGVAIVGLMYGLITLSGAAAAAVEKDREHDEHETGLPL